jgi:hypothetical protein
MHFCILRKSYSISRSSASLNHVCRKKIIRQRLPLHGEQEVIAVELRGRLQKDLLGR